MLADRLGRSIHDDNGPKVSSVIVDESLLSVAVALVCPVELLLVVLLEALCGSAADAVELTVVGTELFVLLVIVELIFADRDKADESRRLSWEKRRTETLYRGKRYYLKVCK